MASGGGSSGRASLSEHRKRTKAFRVDNEDLSSLGSNRQEDRPNNWDFSDWKPSSAYDSGKRIKKGNNNPDREKENKKEREREHLDSGSQSETGARARQHTPATFPRTKMSSKAPMSQRLAMENLRQHLSFSDVDELSTDGERNNERPLVHRERLTNYTSQALAANTRNETASMASDQTRDRNSNISKSEAPDSNEIVGRLMQIRDYIKQASSMMDNLKKSADPGDQGRAKQLNQVIQRLKEQEQKYLDLLLKLSKGNEHCDKLENLVQHLEYQEKDYLKLLEKQLAAREEELLFSQNLTESANSRQESDTEAESVDLDVHSDNSGNTTDANEDPLSRRLSRPNIEDRLGRHSDTELEDLPSARSSRSKESELDNTLVAEPEGIGQEQEGQLAQLTSRRLMLETDVDQKNQELEALRQQHEMLKKMLYQQEQLRALQGRQAALQALQRDAESKLEEERIVGNDGSNNVGAAAAVLTNGIEGGAEGQNDMDALPQELKDLRRRLDYLKNIYDIQDPSSEVEEQRSVNTEQSDLSMTSLERRHLSTKLQDLQDKKIYMDQLLQDLQSLRSEQRPHLNNEMDGQSITSSQGHIMDSVVASTSAGQTASEAQEVLELLESRKKQKKLQDVRGRLNQLRDLVQYYQTGTEFIHGDSDEAGASGMQLDRSDPIHNHNLREPSKKAQVTQKLRQYANSGRRESFDQQSEVSSTQGDTTDTESHVSSSAGAWGDDPEIKDKVRKLKAAKDKLRQLQELVSMVQQSPDMAHALPDDLAELAYSIGGDTASQVSQASTQPIRPVDDESNQSEGEVLPDSSEVYYETQMQEQREELEQLMEERCKLLSIQEQLQKLHEQLGAEEGGAGGAEAGQRTDSARSAPRQDDQGVGDDDESDTNNTRVKTVQETSQVTFQEPPEVVQSYDELYGRMRQQRMLREELREKKKELEIMMSKDRPKKQYSRNQDNQSDNVSFSNKSDPFGSKSEDYTMATWGGSTVDNLESIEEDEDGSGAGQEPDDGEPEDDGYPSDGIVQVEEEEEAQESDDHDTYTIEDEYSPRHGRQTAVPKQPIVENRGGRGGRRRARRGAPLMEQREEEHQHYEYNFWAPDKNKVLNNVRSRRRAGRSKREKADSALEQEVRSLRQQLEDMQRQMMSAQVPPAPGFPLTAPASHNPLVMAHMQQQLVMNLSQSYQQLCLNQHDSADRLRRLENRMLRAESADDIVNAARREHLTAGGGGGGIPSSSSFTYSPYTAANPFHIQTATESTGPFSQRLAAGSTALEADSYLQQYRAARARATAPSTSDAQFRLDPRPFNFESESAAFINNPNAYALARGYSESDLEANYAAQNMQHQVVQTEDVMSEMSAAPSDTAAFLSAARPKQKNENNNQQQAQQEIASLPRRSPRPQTSLAHHTELQSASEYSPMTTARTAHSDNIQIDTIMARDRGKIPPLDLDHILKNRSKIVKNANREVASEVSTVASSRSDAVVGRKFSTPSRANAASRLASRQVGPARPGLSAGISGTTFMDASSIASLSSAVSSVPGGGSVDAVARAQLQAQSVTDSQNIEHESDATISDFTMFETLRETIYAEVATLISQNEMRPHFLIELFRELQMLSTDYLRQRALYVIQDLVTRHLTEEETHKGQLNKASPARPNPHWPTSTGRVLSENTPSESLITSDDEEIKAQLYARSAAGRPRPQPAPGLQDEDHGSVSGSVKSDRFDYAELVDTTSSMSTPTSSNYWDNDHFAKDSLGDTVIHLDKLYKATPKKHEVLCLASLQFEARFTDSIEAALQRMREYERRVAAGEDAEPAEGAVGGKRPESAKPKDKRSEVASSSAQGSDTSNSDVPDDSVSSMSELSYPRIDTQQLDHQIKTIMTEVIPVLKEHMDEVCSQHLLQYIRRLVLSLTKDRDDQHEFARFFHKQLGSIVQDSLAKFEGRKMRECGEDMLVELSEILFNELAFFRLMQDLDDPKAKVKATVKARVKQWQQGGATSTETGERREDDDRLADETTSAADSSESEAELSGVDQESRDVTDQQEEGDDEADEDDADDSESNFSNETDDLGKERDDELAAQMDITEKDDDSESPHKSPVKIELAVSEIKSFTRIGSDEDDEGEDEVQSADDVSETAVSRDIHNEVAANNGPASLQPQQQPPASDQDDDEDEDEEDEEEDEDDEEEEDSTGADSPKVAPVHEELANDSAADPASGGEVAPPGGEAVMNGEVGRFLQVYTDYLYGLPPPAVHDEDEDGDAVTLDDLPAKLAVISNEDAGLEEKRATEDQENSAVAAALEVLDDTAASPGGELAGDPTSLKEPDRPSPTVEFRHDNVLYLTAPDGSTIITPGLQLNESQA